MSVSLCVCVPFRNGHPWRLVELNGFLNALRFFFFRHCMTDDLVEASPPLWYQETRTPLDTIATEHSIPASGDQCAPWNSIPTRGVLVIGSDSILRGGYDLILDEVVPTRKDQVCILGVVLDLALLLDKQVGAVARSAFYQLWLVRQLWPLLGPRDLTTVTHTLVTLMLDFYMDSPWRNDGNFNLCKMQCSLSTLLFFS